MPRKGIVLEMPQRGKPEGPYPPGNTPTTVTNRRVTGLLNTTRERIAAAWIGGSPMRSLRVSYDLPMAALEEVLRAEVRSRLNRPVRLRRVA